MNGLYQVSNLGRVKSLGNKSNHKLEKIRQPQKQNEYYKITLYKNAQYKNYAIHRLVAKAFIPNPDNLPEINHKDENKLNNCITNLEWCDKKYNINYGHSANIRNEKNKNRGLKMTKSVQCIETGIIYSSIIEASRQTGINDSDISRVCRHIRNKTAGGYHWKYVE